MGDTLDYNSLIVDPDFRKLTPGAQQKILAEHDGDFAALTPQAQMKLVSAIPAAENDESNINLGQPQTLGDKTLRVGQESLLGGLAGFGLPQFPESQDDRDSTFAGRASNYMGNLWGGVQNKFTQVANKYDTGNPVKDSLRMSLAPFDAMESVGEGLGAVVNQQLQKTKDEYNAGNPVRAGLHLAAIPFPFTAGIANAETDFAHAVGQQDAPAAANAAGNLGGQAAAIYAGVEPAAADAAISKIGQGVNSILPGTPLSPAQLIRRAIKPSIAKGASLDAAIQSELPRLQTIMESADSPTLQGLVDAVDKERNNVWKQSQKLKPSAAQTLDGTDIHQAILNSISKRDKVINIRDAQNVKEMAEGYLEKDAQGNVLGGKQIPIEDAEDFLKTVHAELDGYYNSNPFQKATKLRSNSEVAALKAEADALRSGIHANLANPELRQTYGNLATIQQQAERRLQQVQNAAINDMPDRGTKIWATVKGVRGLFTGNPEAVMEGATGLAANQMLKKASMPDALIRKAVQPGILGTAVPSGVAGPAIALNSLTPKAPVNYRWDDEAKQLVPVEPLQFSY